MTTPRSLTCILFGHEWLGAGWLGGLSINHNIIRKHYCSRCRNYTLTEQPSWHNALMHKGLNRWEHPELIDLLPDKFTGECPDYLLQHEYILRTFDAVFLADIFDCKVEEMKALGYQ